MPAHELFTGQMVEYKDINDYFDEYYYSAMHVYNRYIRFGLPWNIGYMEMPAYLITIYELFDEVIEKWKQLKIDKGKR